MDMFVSEGKLNRKYVHRRQVTVEQLLVGFQLRIWPLDDAARTLLPERVLVLAVEAGEEVVLGYLFSHEFLERSKSRHFSFEIFHQQIVIQKNRAEQINKTSQMLFSETFDQVRKNFVFTYEKLAGGGVSDLVLVDSDDPLESGIEIIARPPGTRLKNVSLLSGGQRTMAAVALLFAIYLVKPSPFCVLDEIDAALDDANIGRFCEMLRSFTNQSQFLIVTHNKRTISDADTVFGVTMPEKGVSKLISMRFQKQSEVALNLEFKSDHSTIPMVLSNVDIQGINCFLRLTTPGKSQILLLPCCG